MNVFFMTLLQNMFLFNYLRGQTTLQLWIRVRLCYVYEDKETSHKTYIYSHFRPYVISPLMHNKVTCILETTEGEGV